MGDYRRSTRKCSFDEFRPVVREAMLKYMDLHKMGEAWREAVTCCETTSEKVKGGLFGKGKGSKQFTDVMVTTSLVFWGVEDGSKNSTIWAKLENLEEVKDYRETSFNERIPDTGISIFGFPADSPSKSYSFIGLGEDTAGEELKRVLLETWRAARMSH